MRTVGASRSERVMLAVTLAGVIVIRVAVLGARADVDITGMGTGVLCICLHAIFEYPGTAH